MNRVRNLKAFTLIELLVVIAIIAILAAILFPVFAQARESARTSSCLSNEKQIGLGIIQYVQDYDERFPLFQYTGGDGKPDTPWGPWPNIHIGWDKAIQPYVKNAQVFKCPSNDDGVWPGLTHDGGVPTKDDDPTGAVNYGINAHLAKVDGGSNNKLANIRYPAVTILLAETSKASSTGEAMCELQWLEWGHNGGHAHKLNGDGNADPGWDGNTYGVPATMDKLCHQGSGGEWGQSARLRAHHGGANYAFSDGHSKFAKGDASCVVWDRTDQGGGNNPRNESGGTMTYIP